jgi:membrane glycosyltransferase
MPLKDCVKTHALHVLAGLAFGVLAFHISGATFLWLLPIASALILSPLVSWATGLPELGRRMWHWNVFRIPEEQTITVQGGDAPEASPEPLLEAAE